jgi:chromosome partitioning protein
MAQSSPAIVLFAPKGGTGKTTLSAHLLVAAARAGLRPLGVDLDPQRTLLQWAELRDHHRLAADLPRFDTAGAALSEWEEIWDLLGAYDLAVLDLPPGFKHEEAAIHNLLRRADLVVVPIGQSVFDRMALAPWVENLVVHRRQAMFVLNRATAPHHNSLKQARLDLVAHGPLAPVEIPQREDILKTTAEGLTVLDVRGAGGRREIEALWHHIGRETGLCR